MSITLTSGNDTLWAFQDFLGGTTDGATNLDLLNATVDGGAGFDTVMLDYDINEVIAHHWFTLTVANTGVVTLTAGSGGTITFNHFEKINYINATLAVGTSGNDSLTASGNADPGLYGFAGNDTLNGGTGADVMLGGSGNDTYVVDNAGDSVRENTTLDSTTDAGGVDLVQAAISYILGNFVENLKLTGSGTINGTGNTLANVITGNVAANTLDGGTGNDTLGGDLGNDMLRGGSGNDSMSGGAGADVMLGGAGNDSYVVDSSGDHVYESTVAGGATDAGGIDSVSSMVSFALGSFVENLMLSGSSTINGTGNTLANALTGNAGANMLDGGAGNDTLSGGGGNDRLVGGAGADTMSGGAGNDAYYVTDTGDRVSETTVFGGTVDAGGTDLVNSSISFTLPFYVEQLTLAGSASRGTGNLLANVLTGNTLANTLDGGAGNDTLNGGGGNDQLIGGAGADVLSGGGGNDLLTGGAGADAFLFAATLTATGNLDTITDYDAGGVADRIQLDHSFFTAFAAVAAPTAMTVARFFAGTAAHDLDDRIIYDASTGSLYYDPDGTGPTAQIRFAVLGSTAHPVLDATDFFIVP